ncbi:MAG: hypothetical protein KatS3mg077_2547 [Candidatus Binatia bacterium]|nr:MAG: hypothetical protein KatS3mg077_2547 [Candidatus Binatia bacterium]
MAQVARAFEVSETTVRKWHKRYQQEGLSGLRDRSSRPRRLRHSHPTERILEIVALRQRRLTGWRIARVLGMPRSTVARVVQRLGLGRLSHLKTPKPSTAPL